MLVDGGEACESGIRTIRSSNDPSGLGSDADKSYGTLVVYRAADIVSRSETPNGASGFVLGGARAPRPLPSRDISNLTRVSRCRENSRESERGVQVHSSVADPSRP